MTVLARSAARRRADGGRAAADPAGFAPEPGHLRPVQARRAVVVAAVLSVVLSIVVYLADIDPNVGTRRFHVALETADALVLVFLAAVLFGRYRTDGARRNLLLMAAVVVLAVKNVWYAGDAMFSEEMLGDDPVVWSTAASGVLGALILALAAVLPDRRLEQSRMVGRWVIVAAAIFVAAVTVTARALGPVFPVAFPAVIEDVGTLDLVSGHPVKILVDAFTAACYLVAALAFARLAERYQDHFMKWMGVGAVIAAVAFVNYALIPSRFTELLYGGEVLWICATGALLYGALREIASLEAALVRSAVMSERKRVARDLHDGVVQELAYIATQTAWLARRTNGTPSEATVARIKASVERAMDESRGAIAALNREMDEPLAEAVMHAAEEVAERLGADVHLEVDPAVEVPGEHRDALIRITREAVGNAVRHGGAARVELRLTRSADRVQLVITDDGTGFDADAPRSPQSFGLKSMRERAESHGGVFTCTTAPGAGTTVSVTLATGSGQSVVTQ